MLSDRFYIGSCKVVNKRLDEHNGGYVKSTKAYTPWALIMVQEYETFSDARKVEARLKKLKRRDYIEKIVSDGVIKMRL